MTQSSTRRVVVTGLGVIASNGIGREAFWRAMVEGRSAISPLLNGEPSFTAVPVQVAGAVKNFVPTDHIERKLINRTDRMTHFALAAMQEALYDARLTVEQEDPRRVGAVIANTLGGVEYVLKQIEALYTRGPRFVSAYSAIAWLQVSNVGQAAIRYGLKGYCKTPVNDTVGGLDALTMAYGAIRRGAADILITGGCEAMLDPFALLMLARQRQAFMGNDIRGYRPFDTRAAGLIMAEGAGICILEEYEHALQRGAPIYGEIIGYGQTNDAHGLQAPSADGTYYARAIYQAMQSEALTSTDISYFSLDGRAMPNSDTGEVDALRQALGAHLPDIPVSVPRTQFGHSYAAAGAIDTIITLLALKHACIPPTLNCEQLDARYKLNMVRDEARALSAQGQTDKPRIALVGGRGIGGSNVVLALRHDP